VDLDGIRRLVLDGECFFYTHALTEAKKDGVAPEDVVHAILTGEVIEEYPDRQRVLVFAMLTNEVPLHVVCDYSQGSCCSLLLSTSQTTGSGLALEYAGRGDTNERIFQMPGMWAAG